MNALVNVPSFNAQLPDFLRDAKFFTVNQSAAAGIAGGRPAHISIKAGKWRIVDEAGDEQMVNALSLDVVIIDANDHVSKVYYEGAYDPNESAAPTCYSDNGVGPSINASVPQSTRCAGCELGAWGSEVSKVSGKAIKACSDAKKLAVVIAAPTQTVVNNIVGTVPPFQKVYLLQLPATSMRGLADVTKKCTAGGVPLIGLVLRLGFDPAASYPLITFTPVTMLTGEMWAQIQPHYDNEPARKAIIGMDDAPINFVVEGEAGGAANAVPGTTAPRRRGRPTKAEQEAKAAAAAASAPAPAPAAPPPTQVAVPPTSPSAPAVVPLVETPNATTTAGTAAPASSQPAPVAAAPSQVVPAATVPPPPASVKGLLDDMFKVG